MISNFMAGLFAFLFAKLAVKYRTKKRDALALKRQNEHLAESVMLLTSNETGEYENHVWTEMSREMIHHDFWSDRSVIMRTCDCSCCRMIKRDFVKGYDIAVRKKLIGLEGTYIDGLKVYDTGCRRKND